MVFLRGGAVSFERGTPVKIHPINVHPLSVIRQQLAGKGGSYPFVRSDAIYRFQEGAEHMAGVAHEAGSEMGSLTEFHRWLFGNNIPISHA